MLIFTSLYTIETFFATIVIPRSRSRSLLSRIRSVRLLIVTEQFSLMKHFVNQCSFSVVNVSDNRNISDLHG